jgi:hypothetical protein
MLPTQSLLTLSPIALTSQNGLYLAAGVVSGSLLTLSIIIGIFAAVYMPKEDDN